MGVLFSHPSECCHRPCVLWQADPDPGQKGSQFLFFADRPAHFVFSKLGELFGSQLVRGRWILMGQAPQRRGQGGDARALAVPRLGPEC